MVESGGCSAKISPKQLEEILKYLPLPKDPNIRGDSKISASAKGSQHTG